MDAARVLDLLADLESRGPPVWPDGGWGIDALLERQTRPHDDLDLVASLEKVPQLDRALAKRGYSPVANAAPASFELVDSEGHQVDVHPVRFSDTGAGIYRMGNGRDWVYPATGFAGLGRISGREVQCLTPEVQMLCHATGYELDAAHQADVATLGDRFGLPIPEYTPADWPQPFLSRILPFRPSSLPSP